ncbi:guanine deaminase-like [Saccoglossus kowalevskii]
MASQNSVTTLDDQRRFIRRAIDLSYIGACTKRVGEPFGAVIVKDGKIIGEGYNMMTMNSDPTAHGEIVAIRNTCESIKSLDLSGCHMYSSCEPCLMCASAILLTG